MKKIDNVFNKLVVALILVIMITCVSACSSIDDTQVTVESFTSQNESGAVLGTSITDVSNVPEFSGEAYVVINDNNPYFSETDKVRTDAFETYSELDSLGRCGVAYANICKEIMPTEKRGEIGSVKPSGWKSVRYDNVDGKSLYNRCHLIGYQLAGENANKKNLITGTRYLNVEGMLPFEDIVDDYVDETGNHVLYRVTPIYDGDNLLAAGVLMEAYSVEEKGDGITLCVYCYNVQPDININYANGDSSAVSESTEIKDGEEHTYILNTSSKKFHEPGCESLNQMTDKNKQEFVGSRDEIISKGYSPCKSCNP